MMTDAKDRKFVETLKPGDKIFVFTCGGCGYTRNIMALKEVKRVTKPYIIVEIRGKETKFRKDNLEEAGRKFGRMYMGSPHDEIVEYNSVYIAMYERQMKENKCHKIIEFLCAKKLSELSNETLDKYHEILKAFEIPTVSP